jgi:hypothetical protein
MSQVAHNSSGAKFALLNDIELVDELNYLFSENDYTNMDMLEELDLAECVLIATIQGRESLVRTLMDRVGPVRIVVKGNNKESKGYSLNGLAITFNIDEFASHATSPKALKSLFKMIDEYGMKGLVEPGSTFPLLFQKVDNNRFLPKHNHSEFEGLLPELIDGVLRQPELAVALHDESSKVSTPGAYKAMLCWATEQMVKQFPEGLAPLRPYQEVDGFGSMKMWKESAGKGDCMTFGSIEVGVGATEECSQAIRGLFSAMGPESAVLGFRDEQGRVLCETTTDFLLEFPMMACDEDNLKAATTFVTNYCPIAVMAVQAAEVCHRDFGLWEKSYRFDDSLKTRMTNMFDPLFSAIHPSHPLSDRVKDLMTPEQWEGLLTRSSSPSPASLVSLHQAFGIDNTTKALSLEFTDFECLVKGGYRFADDTPVFEDFQKHFVEVNRKNRTGPMPAYLKFNPTFAANLPSGMEIEDAHAYVLGIYQSILKTNLWPAAGKCPVDVTSALKMASRLSLGETKNSKSMALEAYLTNAGFDACIEKAKTATQWITLTQVFSADELKPYLKTMPAKARGRLLESALGL